MSVEMPGQVCKARSCEKREMKLIIKRIDERSGHFSDLCHAPRTFQGCDEHCTACFCLDCWIFCRYTYSHAHLLLWTWKSGRTSSGPRALAMQPWTSSTRMHLCAAARSMLVASPSDQHVHCTQRSVRAGGAGPPALHQSTGFPCPRQ